MAIYKEIYIDLFKRKLIIFAGDHETFKEWSRWYYKNSYSYKGLVEYILHSDDNCQGCFWYNHKTGDNIIELKKFPETPEEIATAVHETLHAVIKLLDFVGVAFKQGGANESYTYLQEYIVYNLLNKKYYKEYDAEL